MECFVNEVRRVQPMKQRNPQNLDVYLYGVTVYSTIHLLDGDYPKADTYGEIKQTHYVPGGEVGNSALILANLGYHVKIDGPFLGRKSKDGILNFYKNFSIDCSSLTYDPSYDGLLDMVLIDSHTRTVFGKFGQYFGSEVKRWSQPDESAIAAAKIVALDPWFQRESELVAEYCVKHRKPYVTIDCAPDSYYHAHAAATVISNEYIQNNFPEEDVKALLRCYMDATQGLVVFTFGSKAILFGRMGSPIQSIRPFQVEVKSTLGAGDTFRAGIVYGLLNQLSDLETVKFAAATAASVCKRFPMALDPPGLTEIRELAFS
jgi:sugar/nucleoside kinase (ribokinase family)